MFENEVKTGVKKCILIYTIILYLRAADFMTFGLKQAGQRYIAIYVPKSKPYKTNKSRAQNLL